MEILESKFGIIPEMILWQIVNFGILLFLLKKFLYGPLLEALEKRRKGIEESIAKVAEVEKQSAEASTKVEEELAGAKEKAHDIVARAEKQASETRSNAQAEATAQADEIIAQGKKSVEAEKESLLASVQKEIADLVVATSGKVLGKEVGGKHDEFIKEEIKG